MGYVGPKVAPAGLRANSRPWPTRRLHAIDATSGNARWIADLTEGSANVVAFNPVISGDRIFVCSKNLDSHPDTGKLWAIAVQTGDVLWSRAVGPARPTLGSACYGSAVAWNDLVIQPWQDSRLFAFDRVTGNVVWSTQTILAANGDDIRWATLSGDVVVASSVVGAGAVVGYSASTGEELWRQTELGGSLFPLAADATVVFVDHGWYYASYEAATGARLWSNPLPGRSPQTPFKATPILTRDRIHVAGRAGSYALRR